MSKTGAIFHRSEEHRDMVVVWHINKDWVDAILSLCAQ